jgi:2-oxoisovalerate dehydrogenase E2 component (dihydrolipoyl transacylase)
MSAPFELKLTDVGEGIVEAEVTDLFVEIGSLIQQDQPLMEIMTEKITLEIPSPISGEIFQIFVNTGDTIPVGGLLLSIIAPGSSTPSPTENASVTDRAKSIRNRKDGNMPLDAQHSNERYQEETESQESLDEKNSIDQASPRPILAAPAARRRAMELRLKLEDVQGSGPAGRISVQDVERYASDNNIESATDAFDQNVEGITEISITGLRRKIAAQMQNAKSRIPHFSYTEECDLTELETIRNEANMQRSPDQIKLTLLPFVMRAMASLYQEYPMINSRYDDEKEILYSFNRIHIGIATNTNSGLVVPVVRDVQSIDIWQCALELSSITEATRTGKIQLHQIKGSTITISSLGLLGGVSSSPIINHPEVAIISPNRLRERPMVINGQIEIRKMMNISASFDHRIVDGHEAAKFVQRLKLVLESPADLMRLQIL